MSMTPAIAIHVTAALGAVVTGPVALWARRAGAHRPRLHRAFGYAWVTLMLITAISALFIHGGRLPNIAGFSPIHLLVPLTLFGLFGAFIKLARKDIRGHRKIMLMVYFGACVGAGVFTLLPDRLLGQLVWGDWLGLLNPATAASHEVHAQRNSMLGQILTRAPLWVWPLLVALVVLGLSQTRRRQVSLARVTILPVAMAGFSVWGTVSSFGATPAVIGLWSAAMLTVLFVLFQSGPPRQASYNATTRRFDLPGSWVPMLLILGIFLTRFSVGAALAVQPVLKYEVPFILTATLVYGVFSGLFAGRAARLLRLAARPAQPMSPSPITA
jgi:uncharacterized membrane protein